MRRPRIGLVLAGGRVTGAAVGHGGRLAHWSLDADDTLPACLAAELSAHGSPGGRVRVALDRSLVIVKAIDVPRTAGRDLTRLMAFELERHVPFPVDDLRCTWLIQPESSGEALRVLVVACEGHVVAGALRLVEAVTRRPHALTVASHDLRSLLPRRLTVRRAVWMHRQDDRTDLVFLHDGGVRLSRSLPCLEPDALVNEVQRTLDLVGWSGCDAVWISGAEAHRFVSAPALGALHAPVSAPPYREPIAAWIARWPVETHAAALPALAVAIGGRPPTLDLLPRAMRSRAPSRSQWVTAGLAALVVVLGASLAVAHGYTQERYARRIADEIRRLDPDAKAVERLASDVAEHKRLLSLLRSVEEGSLRTLAVLEDLTNLVPADAWLQAVTMDRQGVELTGQATAASQLIPLLEGSPALQRVEFTSPVTRAQGKEQFRLRAAWER
jgi:Tfp pilus assembly protein PilN